MATLQGVQVQFGTGINAITLWGTVSVSSASLKSSAETALVKNSAGETIGKAYYNYNRTLNVDFSASKVGEVIPPLPDPGIKCIITVEQGANPEFAGEWLLDSSEVSAESGAYAKTKAEFSRYPLLTPA